MKTEWISHCVGLNMKLTLLYSWRVNKRGRRDERWLIGSDFLWNMSSSTSNNFFHGLQFVFVMSKLGKVQLKILRDKIKKFGGAISDRVNGQTTHLMFHQGVSYESGLKSLNITSLPGMVSTVITDWLSNCIAARNLLPTKEYEVSFNFQWMRDQTENDPGPEVAWGRRHMLKSCAKPGNKFMKRKWRTYSLDIACVFWLSF